MNERVAERQLPDSASEWIREARAREVFDACWARYRAARRVTLPTSMLSAKRQMTEPAGFQWRPRKARAAEYVADFELCGRRALDRPHWEGHRKLFETYYLQMVPYRKAVRRLGVGAGTFNLWLGQIKNRVGEELKRCGLYPPWRYFHLPCA